jgi:hypothetical protein
MEQYVRLPAGVLNTDGDAWFQVIRQDDGAVLLQFFDPATEFHWDVLVKRGRIVSKVKKKFNYANWTHTEGVTKCIRREFLTCEAAFMGAPDGPPGVMLTLGRCKADPAIMLALLDARLLAASLVNALAESEDELAQHIAATYLNCHGKWPGTT